MVKAPWDSGDDEVRTPSTRDSEVSTGESQSQNITEPTESRGNSQNNNKVFQFLQHFKPSDIGCLFVVLCVGMLIAFLAQEIMGYSGLNYRNKTNDTAPPTTTSLITRTQRTESSLIILGSTSDGIVYYFDSPNGIFHKDTITGQPVLVVRLAEYEVFHWSPSREQIALVIHNRTDLLPRLYIVNLKLPSADFEPQLVTPRDINEFPASFGLQVDSPVAWSNDETHIAFVAYDDEDRTALFVTDVPTGTVRQLTEGIEPVTSLGWEIYTDKPGHQDERIVYVLNRDGTEFTYSVEVNGANRNSWDR